MESSKELRFVTWNIDGKINIKPNTKYLSKRADIVFLQETRIGPKNNDFENLQGWKCFFTVCDSQSAGVAILIKHGVKFDYICHDEDSSGDYLVLFCRLCGELFTLVNVYNHKDDKNVLQRLHDYLRETAEGVLVVGGDFNVVLNIVIDRKSKTNKDKQTEEWKTFKKITSSLNLMDAWAYCKPKSVGFTFSSKSRLDMFLLSEDNLDRITNIHVDKHDQGHSPLLMTLKIKENSSNEVPAVASYLKNHGVNVEPDRRAGKINGAEILSVIKSLTDSGHKRPDGISVQTYKKDCCPFTECLKIDFNQWMKNKEFPKDFNSCFTTSESDGRKSYHHFNVKYLIFTMILAKRLELLLNVSSEEKKDNKGNSGQQKEGNKEGNSEQQKEGNKEGNPEQQKEGNKEGNPEQQKEGNKKGNPEQQKEGNKEGNSEQQKEGNKEGNSEQQKEGNKEGNPEQQKEGNKEGNPEQQKEGNKKGNPEQQKEGNKKGNPEQQKEGNKKGNPEQQKEGNKEGNPEQQKEGNKKGNPEQQKEGNKEGNPEQQKEGNKKGNPEQQKEGNKKGNPEQQKEGNKEGNPEQQKEGNKEGNPEQQKEGNKKGNPEQQKEGNKKGNPEQQKEGNKEGNSEQQKEGNKEGNSEQQKEGNKEGNPEQQKEGNKKGNPEQQKEGNKKGNPEQQKEGNKEGNSEQQKEGNKEGNSEQQKEGNKEGNPEQQKEGNKKGNSEQQKEGNKEGNSEQQKEGNKEGNPEQQKEGNKKGNSEQQKEGNKKGNSEQQKEGNKKGNSEQQKEENKRKAEKTDDNNNFYLLTFTSKQQKIEWTFLETILNSLFQNCLIKIATKKNNKKKPQMNEQSLLKDCDHGVVVLTQDIRVLKIILPKVNSSSDVRVLQDGCPLTRSILSLVLKYLELKINANEGYTARVCHFRKCLVIQKDSQSSLDGLHSLHGCFQRDSKIELSELYQSP